jgi:hypothetical protein
MMKKLVLVGFILLFVFCAKKQTTVETEGLEEVIVFGEEEATISEKPVYPTVEEEPVMPPEEELVVPPPAEPVVEEEVYVEPMEEEMAAVPPPVEEQPAMPLPPAPPAVKEEVYTPLETPTAAPAQVLGFRVQIFASSTDKGANRVADDARAAFANQSVYVDHIVPYYKVRIGDCLTREEADVLRKQALNLGFDGAFIVETMITP